MARRCLICKKELAEDNKGFLCQYHKDLAKEKINAGGQKALAYGAAAVAIGKAAYDHREEVIVVVKKGVEVVKDTIKNAM